LDLHKLPVAKQERVGLSPRVKAGLETTRAKGKGIGRPPVVVAPSTIAALRQRGRSWPQITRELGIGVATAHRIGQTISKI
jgi:DNA invertase Pin-like site-specific DNA recombinase